MIYICTLLAFASGRFGGISDAVVGNGENLRLTFPLPVEGVTVRLCVNHGQLVFYASVSATSPNSAVYDWMSEISIGCDDIFIDPRNVENDNIGSNDNPNRVNTNNGRRKRQALNSTMDEYVDLTLYVSIEGVEETNSFVFQTTTGDTSTPGNQTNVHSSKLNVLSLYMHVFCTNNSVSLCMCTATKLLSHLPMYRSATHRHFWGHHWMCSRWRSGVFAGGGLGCSLGYMGCKKIC